MSDTAQDDLLIQASIALLEADPDISGIVGAGVYQKDTGLIGVTTPYLTVGFDFEVKILGVPSNRGSFSIAGWYDLSPSTNLDLLRVLMAGVRRLFDVEHAVSSILAQSSGLKLRYMALRDQPLLVDQPASLYYSPASFDAILDN